MALKQIVFTNEKGNAIAKTREGMAKSFDYKLVELLESDKQITVKRDKKDILIPLAIDKADGEQIFARLSYSITKKETSQVKKTKKKESKGAETIINLFETVEEDEATE